MSGQDPGPDSGMVAAVLKLTDLAARVERVEHSATQRIGELAASCEQALAQVASLREKPEPSAAAPTASSTSSPKSAPCWRACPPRSTT